MPLPGRRVPLHLWPQMYAVAHVKHLPPSLPGLRAEGPPVALIAGAGEVSLIAPVEVVEAMGDAVDRQQQEWRLLTIGASFTFETVGLLAACSRVLAEVNVPVLVVSTYATDHLVVPARLLGRALAALGQVAIERFVSDAGEEV